MDNPILNARVRLADVLVAVVAIAGYWVFSRSVEYRHDWIVRYLAYVGFLVWLPGFLLLAASSQHRVGWVESVAIGLPLGYTWEALLFFGCSAAGWRDGFFIVAVCATLALLAWSGCMRRWQRLLPALPRVGSFGLLAAAVLALLGSYHLAARMYAPAPLWGGQLLHPTHHDWVYLLSRAEEILHHWPLEDPSLAGTPLSYHYLLMVHVAAAAKVTGLETALVMLRFDQIPMLTGLLFQAYALGRVLCGSKTAGSLGALLVLNAGEISLQASTSGGNFGTLFLEWLHVSPTFFFGVFFMGAILLRAHHVVSLARVEIREWILLFVLAAGATAAKGPVFAPIVLASSLWAVAEFLRRRSCPCRHLAVAIVLGLGFLVSFSFILKGWSGEGTTISPLAFSHITAFWLTHYGPWYQTLVSAGMPSQVSAGVCATACATVIFFGNAGVLILGLLFGLRERRHSLAIWLTLASASCLVSGQLLFLESHAEIYFYLAARLPLAALTGAAVVAIWRRRRLGELLVKATHRGSMLLVATVLGTLCFVMLATEGVIEWWLAGGLIVVFALFVGDAGRILYHHNMGRYVIPLGKWETMRRILPILVVVVIAAAQVNFQLLGSSSGWHLWQTSGAVSRDSELAPLEEALEWVKHETPEDAVLVSSLFTPANNDPVSPRVVDRTTVDKHYYDSALSARRLWVEGPAYLRDYPEAKRRMEMIAAALANKTAEPIAREIHGPCYLLLDRATSTMPFIPISGAVDVFENQRIAVYRILNDSYPRP